MFKLQTFANYCRKPAVILVLILLSFTLREVFIAALFPMLKGQDETMHYITVQYLAEPSKKDWEKFDTDLKSSLDIRKLETYNSSEELRQTISLASLNAWQGSPSLKFPFTGSYEGKNESEIMQSSWKRYVEYYPPSTVGGGKLYHSLAAFIEKIFGSQNIFIRFYLSRFFSVLLGALTVFAAYLIFKQINFSEKASLIMTAIVSLQPKLAVYIAGINYDSLLILTFSVFILGAVMFLKHGPSLKNISIIIIALMVGIFTKGTGIILIGPVIALLGYYLWQKRKSEKITRKQIAIVCIILLLIAAATLSKYGIATFLPSQKGKITFSEFMLESAKKTLSVSKNYWGNTDWIRHDYSEDFIRLIWVLEAIAIAGIIWQIWKKPKNGFIPPNKYVFFLIGMLIFLQFGIAFHDWRITSAGGESIIAPPGRYFLPNLPAHIALLFTGIGTVLKKEEYFNGALIFVLLLMFIYNFFTIFNIIIPRFYL